eukprot:TRINITY_DN855_c0_g1_i3.p1 TRINITY_DN855_c0_g1~~TRINITY_DN855_c0_g1_i3.p1  ORF type:complete len:766 (-),score=235.44 TRINITY_DN855_c0_g1_i3:157-2454(-)
MGCGTSGIAAESGTTPTQPKTARPTTALIRPAILVSHTSFTSFPAETDTTDSSSETREPKKTSFKVFISYCAENCGASGDGFVSELKKDLAASGYPAFVAEEDLAADAKVEARTKEALTSAPVFVAVCSRLYGSTASSNREFNLADRLGKPIVVVLHSGDFPPPKLSLQMGTLSYADFTGRERRADALRELCRLVELGLQASTANKSPLRHASRLTPSTSSPRDSPPSLRPFGDSSPALSAARPKLRVKLPPLKLPPAGLDLSYDVPLPARPISTVKTSAAEAIVARKYPELDRPPSPPDSSRSSDDGDDADAASLEGPSEEPPTGGRGGTVFSSSRPETASSAFSYATGTSRSTLDEMARPNHDRAPELSRPPSPPVPMLPRFSRAVLILDTSPYDSYLDRCMDRVETHLAFVTESTKGFNAKFKAGFKAAFRRLDAGEYGHLTQDQLPMFAKAVVELPSAKDWGWLQTFEKAGWMEMELRQLGGILSFQEIAAKLLLVGDPDLTAMDRHKVLQSFCRLTAKELFVLLDENASGQVSKEKVKRMLSMMANPRIAHNGRVLPGRPEDENDLQVVDLHSGEESAGRFDLVERELPTVITEDLFVSAFEKAVYIMRFPRRLQALRDGSTSTLQDMASVINQVLAFEVAEDVMDKAVRKIAEHGGPSPLVSDIGVDVVRHPPDAGRGASSGTVLRSDSDGAIVRSLGPSASAESAKLSSMAKFRRAVRRLRIAVKLMHLPQQHQLDVDLRVSCAFRLSLTPLLMGAKC